MIQRAPATLLRFFRLSRFGSRRYLGPVTAAKMPVPSAVTAPMPPKVIAASPKPDSRASPPGAAKPAVTAVPAAVPPLNTTLERKRLRLIPPVSMIALGAPAV